ncbi:rRNA maturation RNase YbeY [Mycoplasmopsis columbinasalis]|uniref:Endoribonuclease YbeY n=1 Tax=Mycoplasmopsis columbinasalis TaxID=114880 RepID=A0A449BAH2_9BACT|nr:rRNA maturation RNase YbeY [Mycoplasmopsis columbinasalis]VEU78026.1 conserved hypothetical metalloprotease [Mycoplasmopsis columbinasalis]
MEIDESLLEKININFNFEYLDENFTFETEFEAIVANLMQEFDIKKVVEVDVSFVDEETIQTYNRTYRGKDKPTDILSFDFGKDEFYEKLPYLPLGELILCPPIIQKQAAEFNHSLKREYCYLFAHGLIHLMGYDHELEVERQQMNALVDKIFLPLKITRE